VEIDAMPRDVLIELVDACITRHLPSDSFDRLRVSEQEQRASLQQFLQAWGSR
jgi:hypothetical protein